MARWSSRTSPANWLSRICSTGPTTPPSAREPLKVSVELAANEPRAMALAERALGENLTKGLNRIDG